MAKTGFTPMGLYSGKGQRAVVAGACIICAVFLASCGGGQGQLSSGSSATFIATVQVNNSTPGQLVNPLLLGNNIEWSQNGDGILQPGTLNFDQTLLNQTLALSPTVIRYPGGSLADVYQWQAGVGPLESRGMLPVDGLGDLQTVYFGTQEFLTLCAMTGAKPLITLNEVTATAQDAAAWVTLTNITRLYSQTGHALPTVPYWEIGNEPYLTQNDTGQPFTPDQYIAAANLILPAIRAVDPSIKAGIDLLGPDEAAAAPNNTYPQFNTVVLGGLTGAPDFFSVHDAYLPGGDSNDSTALYLATVSGAEQVKSDLDSLRQQVQTYFPGQAIPFALTEFNSLFTLNGSPTDQYPETLASAIYVADLLTMFSNRTDLLMSDYWAILGNYTLGAVSPSGNTRPGFQVLTAFLGLSKGNILATPVQSPVFDAPAVGFFLGQTNVPTVVALATQNQSTIQLLLINKDPSTAAQTTVQFTNGMQPASVKQQNLYTGNYFQAFPEGGLNWSSPVPVSLTNGALVVSLQPHSLSLLQISF